MLWWGLLLPCLLDLSAATPRTITVHISDEKRFALSPLLYSIFFETEINFGSEGGLYAELLQNRDFEGLGRGFPPPDPTSSPANFSFLFDGCCRGGPATKYVNKGAFQLNECADLCSADPSCNAIEADGCLKDPARCGSECWHFYGDGPGPITNGGCEINGDQRCYAKKESAGRQASRLDPHEPAPRSESMQPWVAANTTASTDPTSHPFATNPVSLKVVTDGHGSGIIQNPGYWGIDSRSGMMYNLSFYAKPAEGVVRATATLRCSDGRYAATAVEAPLALDATRGWAKYSTALRAHVSCDDAYFQLGLTTPKPAQSIHLDGFSLVPGDAVAGLFRKDIFDKIKAMNPGFIRMPGGNYLEGTGPSTYWDWRKSVGPKEARPGHYNSAWGYWVTDGMGLHELLLLCEALGSTAQMSVFTGYFLSGGYSPIAEAPQWATAAVDMIEYAIGDANTPFGRMRAAAGHPQPFNLSRVEVGNEEGHLTGVDGYAAHYRIITEAIWTAYPHLTIVASGRWGGCGDSCIGASPCLTGQRCDAWDDHYYLTPDQMAAGKTMYVAAAPVLSTEYWSHWRVPLLTLRTSGRCMFPQV